MARAIVIAHRGASGYLPEHTLEAKALAYAMGADFLEQDCVLTADHVPIVLHDVHLDTVTDVARVFPRRARADGRFYAIDFTLPEIRRLRVTERIDHKTGQPVYPGRFPAGTGDFSIPTLAEELALIAGLNRSTGRQVGIYPEIKKPGWHRRQGADISPIVRDVLREHGYTEPEHRCIVQCFDPTETRRLREELGCRLPLVQLIGENDWNEAETDFQSLRTKDGLQEIARYADGIGPAISHVLAAGRQPEPQSPPELTSLVADAHAVGLFVHPYTVRLDDLPAWTTSLDDLLRRLLVDAAVDGVFSDFPDRTVQIRDRLLAAAP